MYDTDRDADSKDLGGLAGTSAGAVNASTDVPVPGSVAGRSLTDVMRNKVVTIPQMQNADSFARINNSSSTGGSPGATTSDIVVKGEDKNALSSIFSALDSTAALQRAASMHSRHLALSPAAAAAAAAAAGGAAVAALEAALVRARVTATTGAWGKALRALPAVAGAHAQWLQAERARCEAEVAAARQRMLAAQQRAKGSLELVARKAKTNEAISAADEANKNHSVSNASDIVSCDRGSSRSSNGRLGYGNADRFDRTVQSDRERSGLATLLAADSDRERGAAARADAEAAAATLRASLEGFRAAQREAAAAADLETGSKFFNISDNDNKPAPQTAMGANKMSKSNKVNANGAVKRTVAADAAVDTVTALVDRLTQPRLTPSADNSKYSLTDPASYFDAASAPDPEMCLLLSQVIDLQARRALRQAQHRRARLALAQHRATAALAARRRGEAAVRSIRAAADAEALAQRAAAARERREALALAAAQAREMVAAYARQGQAMQSHMHQASAAVNGCVTSSEQLASADASALALTQQHPSALEAGALGVAVRALESELAAADAAVRAARLQIAAKRRALHRGKLRASALARREREYQTALQQWARFRAVTLGGAERATAAAAARLRRALWEGTVIEGEIRRVRGEGAELEQVLARAAAELARARGEREGAVQDRVGKLVEGMMAAAERMGGEPLPSYTGSDVSSVNDSCTGGGDDEVEENYDQDEFENDDGGDDDDYEGDSFVDLDADVNEGDYLDEDEGDFDCEGDWDDYTSDQGDAIDNTDNSDDINDVNQVDADADGYDDDALEDGALTPHTKLAASYHPHTFSRNSNNAALSAATATGGLDADCSLLAAVPPPLPGTAGAPSPFAARRSASNTASTASVYSQSAQSHNSDGSYKSDQEQQQQHQQQSNGADESVDVSVEVSVDASGDNANANTHHHGNPLLQPSINIGADIDAGDAEFESDAGSARRSLLLSPLHAPPLSQQHLYNDGVNNTLDSAVGLLVLGADSGRGSGSEVGDNARNPLVFNF